MRSARAWIALIAISLFVAACGNGTGAAPPALPSAQPSPSPSSLSFKLNPEPTVTASGTVTVVPGGGSTKIEVRVTGLQPNSSHVSHVHAGSCQSRGGIARALMPVVANGQGEADAKSTITDTFPPTGGTWYVVVHAGPDMQGTNASYLLCGNLF